MARGTLRGAAAAWVGLVALQALTTSRGSSAATGLLGTVDGLVKRALDPSVPAIPDHSAKNIPTLGSDGKPNGGALTPGGQYLPPTDGRQQQPQGPPASATNPVPDAYIPWPSVPGTTNA